MAHGSSFADLPVGPDSTSAPFEERDEFEDLASAVSALTSDDLSRITDSLNAADAWDVDDPSGYGGGGFLANQF